MSISTPDRVRFQTPRGRVRVGEVVDDVCGGGALPNARLLVVERDGHHYRVPATDADPVHPIT